MSFDSYGTRQASLRHFVLPVLRHKAIVTQHNAPFSIRIEEERWLYLRKR